MLSCKSCQKREIASTKHGACGSVVGTASPGFHDHLINTNLNYGAITIDIISFQLCNLSGSSKPPIKEIFQQCGITKYRPTNAKSNINLEEKNACIHSEDDHLHTRRMEFSILEPCATFIENQKSEKIVLHVTIRAIF